MTSPTITLLDYLADFKKQYWTFLDDHNLQPSEVELEIDEDNQTARFILKGRKELEKKMKKLEQESK